MQRPLFGKYAACDGMDCACTRLCFSCRRFSCLHGWHTPAAGAPADFLALELEQSMEPWLCPQVAVLLETEEVISEGFQSSKSARLQNGAIRKVVLSLYVRCLTLHGPVLPCNMLSCSKAV